MALPGKLPTTPTEFSSNLVMSLDSSLESDYTRAQYVENHIQQEVTKHLSAIEATNSSILAGAARGIPELSELVVGEAEYSSPAVRSRVDSLKTLIETGRPDLVSISAEVKTAKEKLVQCLNDKKNLPLNCLQEFDDFKNKIATLQ
ncbi:hypothetical protein NADFUDRAFT_47271 [Nadsonia fulvescens var. elongata DSM 6958]|uniref:Uncharacterized protein n=1 Tax=Nadsonia fulvescens var. elongata DSM 6958 TaxID=857566 RepID=A0A1E3PHG6_9ASCO|nr:hypothetical protein NADFUDRAFT_47271 [Nadsonia fulvescens var. elongata DSM 6958]